MIEKKTSEVTFNNFFIAFSWDSTNLSMTSDRQALGTSRCTSCYDNQSHSVVAKVTEGTRVIAMTTGNAR